MCTKCLFNKSLYHWKASFPVNSVQNLRAFLSRATVFSQSIDNELFQSFIDGICFLIFNIIP